MIYEADRRYVFAPCVHLFTFSCTRVARILPFLHTAVLRLQCVPRTVMEASKHVCHGKTKLSH